MNMWKLATGVYRSGFGRLVRPSSAPGLRFPDKNKVMSEYSRTMWHMCSASTESNKLFSSPPSCGCGCRGRMYTKGATPLVASLQSEIEEERRLQSKSSLPSELHGFTIEANMAELNFKKTGSNETITISMNINHSVDSSYTVEGEMKSRPNFEVEIIKNNRVLNFHCSYTEVDGEEEQENVYEINDVTLFEGEWTDKNYIADGSILSDKLYDSFMELLFEKGITNEFMDEVSEIATGYEHSKYIRLLEDIHKFTLGK